MKQKAKKVTEKQRIFCHEYVIDFNGARAYKVAYPNVTDGTARTNAHKLLTNANIQAYIKSIQSNVAELAGVSALRNVLELKKIAYSSKSENTKISAIDIMNKMLGWNQPSKIDVTSNGEGIKQSATIVFTTFKNEDRDSEEV